MLKTTKRTLQRQCAISKEEIINGAIAMLSKKEQLAVRACFEASKVKSRRGMRYSRQWLYECILLRIKPSQQKDIPGTSAGYPDGMLGYRKIVLKVRGYYMDISGIPPFPPDITFRGLKILHSIS